MANLASYDFYAHQSVAPGATYTTGATGTTAAGTVVPNAAGSGAGSSTSLITGATPNDTRGQYNLVTAGTPAAGIISVVNFNNPYSQLPGSVVVTAVDTTASPVAPVPVSATSVTQTGFSITTSSSLTAAHTIVINYHVVA